jgi:transcriptional regulator with XRE-family HTH domain
MALHVERLQRLREENGWSQRELSRRCGIGITMISKYEAGQAEPTTSSLRKMAEVLDVSADFLIGLSDSPRGHLGDGTLSDEDETVLATFRREGWSGLARLSVEHLSK